ncbi:unnamed protein product [Rotaria sp. Silwood1]|nr:unnamed protein product [Rotaria sp. Silwood1]
MFLYDAQQKRSLTNGIFIYTTSNDIKYALINGDHETEVRKDVSGLFQITMLYGDVEEHIKVLRQCIQKSLDEN